SPGSRRECNCRPHRRSAPGARPFRSCRTRQPSPAGPAPATGGKPGSSTGHAQCRKLPAWLVVLRLCVFSRGFLSRGIFSRGLPGRRLLSQGPAVEVLTGQGLQLGCVHLAGPSQRELVEEPHAPRMGVGGTLVQVVAALLLFVDAVCDQYFL